MKYFFMIFVFLFVVDLGAEWHYKMDSGVKIHLNSTWSSKSIEGTLDSRAPDHSVLMVLTQNPDQPDPEKRREMALQKVYALHDEVSFTSPEKGETKSNNGLTITYYSGTGIHKRSGKKAVWHVAVTTNKQMAIISIFAIEEREESNRQEIQKILKSIAKI
jgi:hypothetical protein